MYTRGKMARKLRIPFKPAHQACSTVGTPAPTAHADGRTSYVEEAHLSVFRKRFGLPVRKATKREGGTPPLLTALSAQCPFPKERLTPWTAKTLLQ